MSYERIAPSAGLGRIIECFWTVEEGDPSPTIQKIIPDGFPEVIFHFGDPYQIKLESKWNKQSRSLLGGQITKHFYLRNTGTSSILGIKFRPAAVSLFFSINMHAVTNRVVSLGTLKHKGLRVLDALVRKYSNHDERIRGIEEYFLNDTKHSLDGTMITLAIDRVFSSNGMTTVAELCSEAGCNERQLERMFRKYIGLSPKLYARIIRFAYIFQLVEGKEKINGSELGIASGYYDQSHFIRNFKAFTGEEPSRYFFDEPNLANFFLKKE